MKSKLFIVLVIAACLCLSACTERSANNSQSSENTPPSVISDSQETETNEEHPEQEESFPQQKVDEHEIKQETKSIYEEKYGEYLEHFFMMFAKEFDDVSELNSSQVTFFTLIELMREYPKEEIPFEYNPELDVYYVPKSVFCEKVEQYFGISEFNFVDTSRYASEKDSYMYTFAHGFPIIYPQVVSANKTGEQIVFTVAYTNPEQEENPTIQTLLFTFKEIEGDGKSYLQVISANKANK